MSRRAQRVLAALVVAGLAGLQASAAGARPGSKSTQTEARWVGYDAEAKTVTVRVTKPGKGAEPPAQLALKKGRQATFKVKPSGSILTRTSVAINGKKGELSDIPEGKTVNIYWVPDEADASARFARKIDVIFSEEELDAMYGPGDEAP